MQFGVFLRAKTLHHDLTKCKHFSLVSHLHPSYTDKANGGREAASSQINCFTWGSSLVCQTSKNSIQSSLSSPNQLRYVACQKYYFFTHFLQVTTRHKVVRPEDSRQTACIFQLSSSPLRILLALILLTLGFSTPTAMLSCNNRSDRRKVSTWFSRRRPLGIIQKLGSSGDLDNQVRVEKMSNVRMELAEGFGG